MWSRNPDDLITHTKYSDFSNNNVTKYKRQTYSQSPYNQMT